jgi:hypothetical protein
MNGIDFLLALAMRAIVRAVLLPAGAGAPIQETFTIESLSIVPLFHDPVQVTVWLRRKKRRKSREVFF